MKKQIIKLLFLLALNIPGPSTIFGMEKPELDLDESQNWQFLPVEMKDHVLRSGIEAIIKCNNIFEPFKGVGAFINSFATIDGNCRALAKEITMDTLKSIAKECHVPNRLKNLDQVKLNEELERNLRFFEKRGLEVGEGGPKDLFQLRLAELIIAGANPSLEWAINSFNERTEAILTRSIKKRFDNLASLLIIYGANVNTQSWPLHYAIKRRHNDLVSDLLKLGADPNSINGSRFLRRTSMMIAIKKKNEVAVRMLLQYNINLNLKDYSGKTALGFAKKSGHIEIIKLLEDYQKNLEDNQKEKEQTKESGSCILS